MSYLASCRRCKSWREDIFELCHVPLIISLADFALIFAALRLQNGGALRIIAKCETAERLRPPLLLLNPNAESNFSPQIPLDATVAAHDAGDMLADALIED
jgi:hypothetical protein